MRRDKETKINIKWNILFSPVFQKYSIIKLNICNKTYLGASSNGNQLL